MMEQREYIQVHPKDNVAVALRFLPKGSRFVERERDIELTEDIPFGHKFALCPIAAGENIFKYGNPIGYAIKDIAPGAHVHTQNVKTNLEGKLEYTFAKQRQSENSYGEEKTFLGYRRANGKVGTRNELWVIPTVGCVNHTVEQIVQRLKRENKDGGVDDIVAIGHPYGCSQMGQDQEDTQKMLAGIIKNPNAGGVLVVSLGCENNNLEVFRPYLEGVDESRIRFLVTQEVEDEYETGCQLAEELLEEIKKDRRTQVPIHELVVGFKCGGSDGFSGLSANPLCGAVNDYLTHFGAATLLTEVPEMFGAEKILMNRAKDEEVFSDIVNLINGYKQYYIDHHQVVYENPSPGNKQGGITTLEEKSLGCIQKGGDAEITNVLPLGGGELKKGLNLLQGPGNDLVSCTNLLCAGATMILFTTGRGNPFGTLVPTLKLSSNSPLAEKKSNWIDFNAGVVLEGCSMEEAAELLLEKMTQIASGEEKAKNEENGYKDISLFKSGVIL